MREMHGYLAGVPLPWDDHGVLLQGQFRNVIEALLDDGCDGLYLFGTSGEGYAVSDEEFGRIVEIFVNATTDAGIFRQVGCFGLSSSQVVRRCAVASELGADSVQITLPFWKELNDFELRMYFEDVCGELENIPFLFYNNPRNKRRLNGKELEALSSATPNLRAVKTGSGAWLEFYELVVESPSLQHFVTEPAFPFCHGVASVGLIPSSNYANPGKCRAYYKAVTEGDHKLAQLLHAEIVAFFHATAVPLLRKGYVDGAVDKAYARIRGMEMSLEMKSPYAALSDEDFSWLKETVLQTGFLEPTGSWSGAEQETTGRTAARQPGYLSPIRSGLDMETQ